MRMKALSIRQPWAGAILLGLKDREYRTWRTNYRGPLLIHASKTIDRKALADYCPTLSVSDIATGALIGVVDVTGCESDGEGGWAWLLANPRWLDAPIPCKGMVGLFPVDLDPSLLPTSSACA